MIQDSIISRLLHKKIYCRRIQFIIRVDVHLLFYSHPSLIVIIMVFQFLLFFLFFYQVKWNYRFDWSQFYKYLIIFWKNRKSYLDVTKIGIILVSRSEVNCTTELAIWCLQFHNVHDTFSCRFWVIQKKK